MKTIKELLEVYKPKSPDEQKFVDKHVTIKHKDRNGNGDEVFNASNVKTIKRKEERHGYDSGEDEKVYEEVEEVDESYEDLAFFDDLLEMNLDEDTFTDASLAQLHVMKHKQYMDKLEKSSKMHPLKKVTELNKAKKKLDALRAVRDQLVAKHEKAEAKKKIKEEVEIEEKTLTPAELKKREEIAKAMERENPGMDKSKKMAIATAQAKKVAEGIDEEIKGWKNAGSDIRKARSRAADAAKDVKLVRLKKNGEESKLHDATSRHNSEDEARAMHTRMVKLNPGRSIAHNLYVGGKLVGPLKEEVEEIEELSRDTLGRYSQKAKSIADNEGGKDRSAGRMMAGKKRWGGTGGIEAAKVPATNEEVEEIEELSKDTLSRYANRALNDVRNANQAKIRWQQDPKKTYSGTHPKTGEYVTKSAKEMEDEHTRVAKNREKGVRRAVDRLTKEEVEELDELSKKTLGSYVKNAQGTILAKGMEMQQQVNRGSSDSARQKTAKKVSNRLIGVNKAVDRLTKEDIINRAIDRYMPEDVEIRSLEDRLLDKIEHLPESHAATLLVLFNELSEDNQKTMLESVDTQEGINSLLDFAIQNRGE